MHELSDRFGLNDRCSGMRNDKCQTNDETRMSDVNQNLIALAIRQPWVELILRGVKSLEIRSRQTSVRGRIYLYASKRLATIPAARRAMQQYELDGTELPRGMLVGTVEIVGTRTCCPRDTETAGVPQSLLRGRIGWELARPRRLKTPLTPKFLPYGVWFYPYQRRNGAAR